MPKLEKLRFLSKPRKPIQEIKNSKMAWFAYENKAHLHWQNLKFTLTQWIKKHEKIFSFLKAHELSANFACIKCGVKQYWRQYSFLNEPFSLLEKTLEIMTTLGKSSNESNQLR